ncbi:hypothetical protein H6P81_020746 [Aristolochia fimbriata]|uniref:UDP-glycosyltransferase n=1 Tax=Aristolochia fimbriata TaxID=158543 RepID=A0AAV7DY89_ARIFI|nr:hypothetical protein H6P81_020746 [Aristolochia fimbriata]
MGKPHAVVVPFPAQGHVRPLVELSHRLVDLGICFATVPDGLEPENDRSDLRRLCIIAALLVAKKMGVPGVGFWPASSGLLALSPLVPKLIESGTIHSNGESIIQNQIIQLSPTMPEINTNNLWWNCYSDPMTRKFSFKVISKVVEAVTLVDEILCNSFAGIEAPALGLIPKAIPIGPLLSTNRTVSKPVGNFWAEDPSCLTWLHQQQDCSVIYVAFGSLAILNQTQFEELAAGLEQTGRPFLWVVRPNLISESPVVYPEDFLNRVENRGKIVSWAPQQEVLCHRAVACFVSHCGWNSTTEGLSNGVPFLCWPNEADQFFNQKYICEVWKIGFELKPNEDGIITLREIQGRVEALLCDEGIRRRAVEMKEMAESSCRISVQNLCDFVERIKNKTN